MGYKTTLRAFFLTSVLGLSIAKSLPSNPGDRVCVEVRKSVLSPLDLRVYVTVQSVDVLQKFTCYADVLAKPNAINMRITSIHRLDDENILLVKRDEFKLDRPELTFLSISEENCKLSPLQINHYFLPSKNGAQKELDITYESSMSNGNSTSLDFDWHQKGVRVEFLPDNQLLLQFHDAAGTLKVRLYKSSSSFIELLSMKSATEIDIVSANTSFCWVRHPGEDNVVTCSKFNKYGELEYRHSLVYPEKIAILHTIGNTNLGEIQVLTKGLDCQSENCKMIYYSQLSKDTKPMLMRCVDRSFYECLNRNMNDYEYFTYQRQSLSFACNNGTIHSHFNVLETCRIIGIEPSSLLVQQPKVELTREEKEQLFFLLFVGSIMNAMNTKV